MAAEVRLLNHALLVDRVRAQQRRCAQQGCLRESVSGGGTCHGACIASSIAGRLARIRQNGFRVPARWARDPCTLCARCLVERTDGAKRRTDGPPSCRPDPPILTIIRTKDVCLSISLDSIPGPSGFQRRCSPVSRRKRPSQTRGAAFVLRRPAEPFRGVKRAGRGQSRPRNFTC